MKTRRPLAPIHALTVMLAASMVGSRVLEVDDPERRLARRPDLDPARDPEHGPVLVVDQRRQRLPPLPVVDITTRDPPPKSRGRGVGCGFGPGFKFCRRCGGLTKPKGGVDDCTC